MKERGVTSATRGDGHDRKCQKQCMESKSHGDTEIKWTSYYGLSQTMQVTDNLQQKQIKQTF